MGAVIEPEINTVTPIVAGAGLTDILTRSGLHFIIGPLFNEVLGNLVVGCAEEGTLYLSQGDSAERCRKPLKSAFADTPGVAPGSLVTLENLETVFSWRPQLMSKVALPRLWKVIAVTL
jgi:hypothetical protein